METREIGKWKKGIRDDRSLIPFRTTTD